MPRKRRMPKGRRSAHVVSETIVTFLRDGHQPKGGDYLELLLKTADENLSGLREDWAAVGAAIVAAHIEAAPGTRPHGWWLFSAPRWTGPYQGRVAGINPARLRAMAEPRQRLGGVGTPSHECLNIWPSFEKGLPTSWVDGWSVAYYNGRAVDIHGQRIGTEYSEGSFTGVAPDPWDPPRFESEAAYLRRHGLLTVAEQRRLRPRQFEPEVLLVHDPRAVSEALQ